MLASDGNVKIQGSGDLRTGNRHVILQEEFPNYDVMLRQARQRTKLSEADQQRNNTR